MPSALYGCRFLQLRDGLTRRRFFRSTPGFSLAKVAAFGGMLCVAGATHAQEKATAEKPPADKPAIVEKPAPAPEAANPIRPAEPVTDWQEALFGGKFSVDLRLRFENVHQEAVGAMGRRGQGYAFSERIRLGYTTKPLEGFSGFIELEDVHAIDDDTYDDTLGGNVSEGVIADPQDTELNQLYVKYANDWFTFIGGRQRITLDDHRFIGNVGWRQNEQTFDAISAKVTPIENLDFQYAYVDDVNRIFGPDADLDFQSDSHLINVSYGGLAFVKITGFAYLLDFENSAANSSDTYGFRLTGSHKIDDDWSVGYTGSYARQSDAGDHPTDYSADYYNIEGSVTRNGWGTVGVGYEVLGSDDGTFGFRTPLATLHAFNGWADVFLTTPATGLEDLYAYVGFTLPWDVKAKVVYHWFEADHGGADFGEELDVVLTKSISQNVSLTAKFADFRADDAAFSDVTKVWFQIDIKF